MDHINQYGVPLSSELRTKVLTPFYLLTCMSNSQVPSAIPSPSFYNQGENIGLKN